MERLIIKKFGPIGDIELNLKKVSIFIGEQGTGKSAVSRLLNLLRFDQFIKDLYNKEITIKDYLKDHDIIQYLKPETEIYYEREIFSIEFTQEKLKINISDNKFEQLLIREVLLLNELSTLNIPNEKVKHKNISNLIGDSDRLLGKFIGEVSFIPTERILLPYLAVSAFSLNKVIETLPNYIRNAGTEFEFFKIRFEQKEINVDLKPILGRDILFYYKNNIPTIKKGDEDFPLTQAESGIQSLLPLLAVFETYKNYRRSWTYIVEEPELNLFPNAQYNLIKYLVSSVGEREDRSIIITTHSPYVLTSLNNMMYAYKVGQSNDDEADKIIPRNYWLNPNDVSVYMLKDGGYEDIFDREEGLIKAEKIDGVTDVLNNQFSELLNLEFAAHEPDTK